MYVGKVRNAGVGGITKFQSRQMGGVTRLYTRMIGGITKIPRPNSERFCSPPPCRYLGYVPKLFGKYVMQYYKSSPFCYTKIFGVVFFTQFKCKVLFTFYACSSRSWQKCRNWWTMFIDCAKQGDNVLGSSVRLSVRLFVRALPAEQQRAIGVISSLRCLSVCL